MGVIINMFEEGTIVTVIFFLTILFAMFLLCFFNFVDETIFLSKDSEKTKNEFSINTKKENKNHNLVVISKIKNARNVKYDIFSFRKPIVKKPINNIFKKNIFHINENIEMISKININDFIKNKDLKDI